MRYLGEDREGDRERNMARRERKELDIGVQDGNERRSVAWGKKRKEEEVENPIWRQGRGWNWITGFEVKGNSR